MTEMALWLVALTTTWLIAQAALWGVILEECFAFAAFSPEAWRQLHQSFVAGGTLRFDFVATLFGALLLALAGEGWLILSLPSLLSWLPPLPDFRARTPRLKAPRAVPPPPRREPKPALPPRWTPPPTTPPPASPGGKDMDSACLARMLALFEVWNEPPQPWIREAMQDEVAKFSDEGWSLLRELGPVGVRLAALLQAEAMIPARPSIQTVLGEILAPVESEPPVAATPSADPPRLLTTGAAWLCELLDHFAPDDGQTAEDLLGRAMRGMTAEDWACLDRFPEKASQVRVLTDRFADDLRRNGKAGLSCAPPDLLEGILRQFGFTVRPSPLRESVWAERDGLALLLKLVDLKQRRWRLSSGPLGPWQDIAGSERAEPGRELWQHVSMSRLRWPAGTRVDGVLVAHGGSFEDETRLSDGSPDGLKLVWLNDQGGDLPHLQHHLAGLAEERIRVRPHAAADRHAAAPP